MIRTNHLDYGYKKNKPILKDICLSLPEGHIYGLLGKNGVGKSTLLKLLSGALIGTGECEIDGQDPRQRQPELLRQLRLVPENEALYNNTVDELALVTRPLYPTFDDRLLDMALREFEVPRDQRLLQMSLGQQKKALISLSLACGTPYLFMDEPTNGMDIPSKATFRRIAADCLAAHTDETTGHCGQTVIISTHQIDDLEDLIDAVVILENNGVLLSASLEEIGQKLCFGEPGEGEEVLYSERTLHGEKAVMLNRSGIDAPVDVKLLFTAVVKNPARFKQIFQHS